MRLLAVAACGALLAFAPSAHATIGPGCGLAPCPDSDGDGFVACACAPAGLPCDCDDADPTAFPGAPEACDATKDRSCNGRASEGCDSNHGCRQGLCVPRCIPLDDFGCAPRSSFDTSSGQCLCAPTDCKVFGCPPGQTCDDEARCVESCHAGVRCPAGQRCRGEGCVDLCAGVTCPAGAVCTDGACVPSCDCPTAPCAEGRSCDRTGPDARCVDTACIGVTCPAGSHCERGACVDDCAGVVCPPKRVCRVVAGHGQCVDLCSPDPCALGFVCDWRTGACPPYEFGDAGFVPGDRDFVEGEGLRVIGGGWVCTAGIGGAPALGVFTALGVGVVAIARRRRITRARD